MKKNRHNFFRLFPSCLILLVLIHGQLFAQPEKQQPETATQDIGSDSFLADPESEDDFEYTLEGRGDPFMPFLVDKKTPDVDMNEVVDTSGELSGMQLFEPGQLTVVAIVKSMEKEFAMVQDFTGKGYIITKGIKIGRRGVITDIIPNQVIVEETAYTRSGKKLTNEIIMYLKQEGDEQ